MKKFNELPIIEKIFIKEYAQRKFNLRYHTKKPNAFCELTDELSVNFFLSSKL